jgi:hypothetical protein
MHNICNLEPEGEVGILINTISGALLPGFLCALTARKAKCFMSLFTAETTILLDLVKIDFCGWWRAFNYN